MPADEHLSTRLRSEFAVVDVTVLRDGNGVRMRVRDPETGACIVLDPLELEALTRMEHRDFGPLIVDRFPDI
jgi:hypothetical protein